MASLSSEAAGARQARLTGELIASRAWSAGPGPAAARWAVASAALSPVATIGGWLVAEALQPPSYSPLRSTISGLAGLGATDRWIMTIALLMVGASYFATAACLPALWVPARIVLMVAGLSSIGIALSPEPARGSTPQHLAWTSLGAVAITVWPAFTARQGPSPPPILQARGAAAVTAVFLALLAWLIFETQGGGALGLAERLVSAVEETWPLVVTLALRYAAEPADFTEHVTPDDSSAVQEIAKAAPAGAHVGKAFNTVLPSVLAAGHVEGPLDLFIAGDGDAEALLGGRANEEVVGVGALRGDELGRNRT